MKYLEIYQNYLQITSPKNKGFTSVSCPFHDDNDKSAGIDLDTGVFKCLKCGINYSITKFISVHDNIPMGKAGSFVDTYRVDKKIRHDDNNFSKKFIFSLERQDWKELYLKSKRTPLSKVEIAKSYVEERQIDIETLIRHDIGFLKAEDLPDDQQKMGDVLTFPYFYNGKLVGLRWRNANGTKSGVKGSLAIPWGIDNLPTNETFGVITEGESDKLILDNALHKRGITDVKIMSLPGSFYKQEWDRDLGSLEKIFFIPDTDESGNKFCESFLKQYGADRLKIHHLRWKPRQVGKDLSEWAREPENNINVIIDELLSIRASISDQGLIQTTSEFTRNIDEEESEEALIHGLLYEGQTLIIGGPAKSKKTWLLLNLLKTVISPETHLFDIETLSSTKNPPNILFIELEGSKSKFKKRVKKVLSHASEEFRDNIHWWFKPAIKLDNVLDVEKLHKKIEKLNIGLIIFDPMQRLHTQDEDKSTAMGIVWDVILNLSVRFPKLSTVVVHHFGKDKGINDGLSALRGTSRSMGEVDSAILIEPRPKKEEDGIKLLFITRDEEQITTDDGMDVFKLNFNGDSGLLSHDTKTVKTNKKEDLENELAKRGEWLYTEALTYYNITAPTLDKYIKDSSLLAKTQPAPGHPVVIKWTGKGAK